jgi:UDP-N-acetylmuramate dehydrogenase
MLEIKENVPLAPLTSFRIGGEARFFAEVKNIKELKEALEFTRKNSLDHYILGGGSNVLIGDQGFNGMIIRPKMNEVFIEDSKLKAQAGAALIKVINTASGSGLSGIASLAGIPGTVGGAVRGNAGAFGTEIGPHVFSVEAFDCETGEIKKYTKEECDFSYRSSMLKKNKNLIILSVTFELQKGDPDEIKKKVSDTILKRTSRGLHGVMSAGSYFMNPVVSNKEMTQEFESEKGIKQKDDKLPAGWLIQKAGLSGKKIGGAMVHEEHANYIVNTGEAKAEDVIMLVSYVKQQVRDQFGIQLQEEVNYVGF